MMFVWGSPHHVYGSVLPPELVQAGGLDFSVAESARFGIATVAPMFATMRYVWPSAATGFVRKDSFTRSLRRYFETVSHKGCPASVLLRITNATVLRNIVHCSDGAERRVLHETFRTNERVDRAPGTEDELAAADTARFADPDYDYLFLGSAGSFNYGHWLVDDLPRAKAAAVMMASTGRPVKIVVPSYGETIDGVRIESLRLMLRCEIPVELVRPGEAVFFPVLHYVTPVSEHPLAKSPLALDYVVREVMSVFFAGEKAAADVGGQRLYVDRWSRNGRVLLNAAEVKAKMEALGFRVIDPETMSFAEQARAFSQASVVVGQMGAAMTNTMFSPPMAAVFHLAPHGWQEPFYFDLAVVRGHRYRVLFGETGTDDRPAHFRDFAIDVDALAGAIAAL